MSDICPCYVNRINTINCKKKEDMINYVTKALNSWKNISNENTGIIMISITEKDKNWKLWIECLQTFKQVTFTRTLTKYHDGAYWCFLACIPCNPVD